MWFSDSTQISSTQFFLGLDLDHEAIKDSDVCRAIQEDTNLNQFTRVDVIYTHHGENFVLPISSDTLPELLASMFYPPAM